MRAMIVPSVSHVKRAFRARGSQLQVLRAHGAGQAVLGARTVAPDRLTPQRARWRETMRAQAQLWTDLTHGEKQSWHDYAGRYGPQLDALRTRPSCESFHGYRVFSAATSNLLAQGLAPCRTAPLLAPFDEVPAIGLVSLHPVLRLRVEHRLGTLSGYALQVRLAPPTATRSATPRRKHVRPVCGTVANSTFPLLPSGSTLDIPTPAVSVNLTGCTGIEARLLRLSDGMAGPWAWFILEPPATSSDDREARETPARPRFTPGHATLVPGAPASPLSRPMGAVGPIGPMGRMGPIGRLLRGRLRSPPQRATLRCDTAASSAGIAGTVDVSGSCYSVSAIRPGYSSAKSAVAVTWLRAAVLCHGGTRPRLVEARPSRPSWPGYSRSSTEVHRAKARYETPCP